MNFRLPSHPPIAWPLLSALLASCALSGCKTPETTGTNASNGAASNSSSNAASSDAANVNLADVQPAPPYKGTDILLGEYASLTGPEATFGISTDNGIKMAIAEQNARGGLLGKQIRLQAEDDASQPSQAATAVLRLINNNNVLAVLGEVASSNSLAAAPICQKAQVPMVSPSSTNPKVTKVGNYIFRTCFTDTFQGAVDARFARETLKAKNVAVLTDSASDYSKGLSQAFSAEFQKGGGKVNQSSYTKGDKDFRALLTSIKQKNPDLIFLPGYYTDVGIIAQQAKSLNMKQPFLGGDGWDSPKLLAIGKSALQGCYFSNHYSPDSPDPRVKTFVAEYKKRYGGQTPDALAAVGYDATLVMLDAIKRAAGTSQEIPTRQKIRDALATTKNVPGVTGAITIDAERNAVKPITILKIQGNNFVPVKVIKS